MGIKESNGVGIQGSGRRERLITEYAGDSSERFPAVLKEEKEMLVKIGIEAPRDVSVWRAEIYYANLRKRLAEAKEEIGE